MGNSHRNIKVSVIVPVYNAEKYLEETIESIKKQTLKDIEVIFVDDGSTDGSPDMLISYRNQDPEIVTVIRQENQYAGVARNNGLKQAGGKYVAFWDADDFSDPTQLEKLYNCCEETGAEVGVCGMLRYDQQTGTYRKLTTVINKKLLPGNKEVYTSEELQSVIFNAFSFHSPNKLFLRSFLEKNDICYSSDRISEDTVFIMKALILANKIAIVDEPLYVYRIDSSRDNLTSTIAEDILSKPRAFCEMKAFMIESGLYNEKVERSFANKALSGCIRHMKLTRTYDSYVKMYDYLMREEGLIELSIKSDDEEYYYNSSDYAKYMAMKKTNDVNEFLYWDKLYGQEIIKEKDIKLRESKETIKKLKSENKTLKNEIKRIKASKTYRYASKISGIKKAVTGK